jgi:electron-transferring-flavoprotein dehydrogenase
MSTAETDVSREVLEVDVLYVGAGPANLASAYRLAQLVADSDLPEAPMIAIIEKSADIGQHILSGAVLDPRALRELIPDFDSARPFRTPVTDDRLLFLTETGKIQAPFLPPMMRNHGKYVVSLNEVVVWLAEKVGEMGVQIFPGFAGAEMLYDGDRVVGVRTGDKGVDREGQRKPNFEPGIDIHAKVTVLGEGARGSLCKKLFAEKEMHGAHPQVYATGVKEIWETPAGRLAPGSVIHTLGWPNRRDEFGGGFVYQLDETRTIVGHVLGLDYRDPFADPHAKLQQLKTHPAIAPLLEGGRMEKYGAATIPEGGLYAMSELVGDGVLVVGDSAGFLNGMRLKGIHLGMKSGMMAAEAILKALRSSDSSAATLSTYRRLFESSWALQEMRSARNFHQAFQGGMWAGLFHSGLQMLTGGRGLKDPWYAPPGHEHMRTVQEFYGREYSPPTADGSLAVAGGVPRPERSFDGKLSFDKNTCVYHGDTSHEEDQPCHLRILDPDVCQSRCTQEYGNPCQHFCPANVYEWTPGASAGEQNFQINFSNCVHCKTCDIMDPYQIIDWVTPEGGGGPNYSGM